MNTNSFGSKIIDNRFIGKVQLNADDLGGAGCTTWEQYRQVCDNIVLASYARLHGKGIDSDTLGICVNGLFNLFGVDAKAVPEYQHRLMVAVIARKPKRSDTLKNAIKAQKAANDALNEAIADDEDEETIEELQAAYDEKVAAVEALYAEPRNYWFELEPMLDRSKKHATASARKAIEDVIADIISERSLMTAEELQAEAKRQADERRGRKMRKEKESKKSETDTDSNAEA